MTNRFSARAGRQGFTIIELLVSVGVTVLLVSLMLGIVTNISAAWNRSSASLETGNQARLVLDRMAEDLQSAVMRRDTNAWLVAAVQDSGPGWTDGGSNTFSIPTASTPPLLEDYRFGPYGVWLRFFASVAGKNTSGDNTTLSAPRAVAYQIIRTPIVSGSSEIRYQMFRSEVSPDLTFQVGYNLFDSKYASGGLGDAASGSASIRTPDLSRVIANNVVDFGVRIYESTTLKFPTSKADVYVATTDTTKGTVRGYPDAVEIFVRILSAEGAQQLELLEDDKITGNWWDIVQSNSRVYTRRVALKATSL